jgi:murein L,D-transpeptidase YcbB/YkuD
VVYQTAFVDSDGTLQFRPDVYNRDAEIWPHLSPAQQPVAQRGPGQPQG